MTQRATRKFGFDDFCDFEQDTPARKAQAAQPAPATYSDLELAEARSRGYAEGQADAQAAMEQSLGMRQNDAVTRIADGIEVLVQSESERSHKFRKASFDVAIAALRKLMPELSRRFGRREVEAAIEEILREQMEEPRIVVRVNDTMFDELNGHVDALAQRQGYSGKLILLAEAGMGPSDIQVEWADGGAERSAERSLADITQAVLRLTGAQMAGIPTDR